uniref:tRNA (34-2'-O)-methyltransferase regulator WDR6-like isoform X1 n=1 Tax=Myxine glutinosa TaxID=7769 RepID=UPI00358E87D6
MASCERLILRAPVSALAFQREFLLAGEGPILHVFATREKAKKCANPICSLTVLGSHCIHGIRPHPVGLDWTEIPPGMQSSEDVLKEGEDKMANGEELMETNVNDDKLIDGLTMEFVDNKKDGQSEVGQIGKLEDKKKVENAKLVITDYCTLVCIFGGKGLAVVRMETRTSSRGPISRLHPVARLGEASDWILDVQWIRADSGIDGVALLAIVLAHNLVQLWSWTGQTTKNGGDWAVLCEARCRDSCLLGAATLTGHTWSCLSCFSCTLDGRLLIWKPATLRDSEQPVEVWQQLENNAGMTFAVSYDRVSGLLVTASDDRSVRVWKLGQIMEKGEARCQGHVAQETDCTDDGRRVFICDDDKRLGIGDEYYPRKVDTLCWKGTISSPRVLFGHLARVWCVCTWRGYRILSAGEDGACLAWCLEDGSVINACRERKGGVRSIAVNEDLGLAALGGGDGAIWLWEVEGEGSTGRQELLTLKKNCGLAGHPKVVAVASKNLVVVATDKGTLVSCDVASQFCCDVLTEPSLASYVAMATTISECESIQEAEILVALGGLHGQVLIFPLRHPELLQSLEPYTGKVHSLTWVCARPSDRAADVPGRSWYLFSSGSDGLLICWEVSFDLQSPDSPLLSATKDLPAAKLSSHSLSVTEKGRFSLPCCRHRWHTCIAFVPFYQPRSQPFAFICGDRCGNLCFFYLPPSGDISTEWICREPPDYREMSLGNDVPLTRRHSKTRENVTILEPTSLLRCYHGRNGVTWVGLRGYNRVWSTGRDGAWRETKLIGRDGDALRPVRSRRPALHLDWLARIVPSDVYRTDDSNDLLLGFRGDTFVVMRNCLGEGEVNVVSCGGGHRSWDFFSSSATENLFAFIKAGDVILSYSKLPELGLLQTGLHTRHTTCVQVLQYHHGNVVLATGSDDTTLRLLLLHKDADGIWRKHGASVINEHLSGVRAVAVATDTQSKVFHWDTLIESASLVEPPPPVLVFSGGGRSELRCSRVWLCDAKEAVQGRETRNDVAEAEVDGLRDYFKDGEALEDGCILGERFDSQKNGETWCDVEFIASHRLGAEKERRKHRHLHIKPDPDTRYMSLSVLKRSGSERVCFVGAAGSDGFIRLFVCEEDRGSLYLLAESQCQGRCVLCIDGFEENGHIYLCAGITDGTISIWDVTNMLEGWKTSVGNTLLEIGDPCKQILHHQSGVACIEARVVAKGRVVIVSGGDDNALSMTTIVVEPGGQCVSLHSIRTPRADASQVTGVKVLGVVEGAEYVVVATVTAEQRLSLWKLSYGGEEFPEQLLSFYNHVGDTAALDWWEDGVGGYCIVMCGLGLELVRVTLPDLQLKRTAF